MCVDHRRHESDDHLQHRSERGHLQGVARGRWELGSFKGRTATLTVGKDKDDIIVSCSAPNHEPRTQRLVSKTQAAGVVGGLVLDLGITDMMTGAMWKYPSDVSIVLDPVTAVPTTVPTPSASVTPMTEPIVRTAELKAKGGQELLQVSKLARDLSCHSEPSPELMTSGPGFEAYPIKCANGDSLIVRCDTGVCRALR